MKHFTPIFWIVLSIFVTLGLISCNDKDELSSVNIVVGPNEPYFSVNSDGVKSFNINVFSDNGTVKHVIIELSDDKMNKSILLDTIINQKQSVFNYVYRPSPYNSDMEVTLKFTAYSSTNESISTTRKGIVVKIDKLIEEYSGFTMYSADSKRDNGFCISKLKTILLGVAPESEVDIYDYADSTLQGNRFNMEWRSLNNISFVKYNGFDYSASTEKSIKDAYSVGVKQPFCQNIKNDDIIIVGVNDDAIGVIKVVNVYSNNDVANDRYLFNIKPIR